MTNELLKEELEDSEQTQEVCDKTEDEIATEVEIIDEESQNSQLENRTETKETWEANEEEVPNDEQLQEENEQDLSIKILEQELKKEKEARLLSESQLLCMQLLEKENLPKDLAPYLTANTPDETERIITGIARVIKKAINKGVLSRLETIHAPARSKNEMTREQFKGLSLAQRQQLYKTDKQLYRELTNKQN